MTRNLTAAVGLALAVALVVPATAATPKAGSWSGKTRQDRPISFKVTPGGAKVKKLKVGFRGTCENGGRVTGTTTFGGKYPVNDGKFTARGGTTTVKGTFTRRKRAKGTLKYNSTTFDPITYRQVACRSGKVRWRAKR